MTSIDTTQTLTLPRVQGRHRMQRPRLASRVARTTAWIIAATYKRTVATAHRAMLLALVVSALVATAVGVVAVVYDGHYVSWFAMSLTFAAVIALTAFMSRGFTEKRVYDPATAHRTHGTLRGVVNTLRGLFIVAGYLVVIALAALLVSVIVYLTVWGLAGSPPDIPWVTLP